MKSKFITLALLGYVTTAFSQVGINTSTPKASLHIEPSSTTTPSGIDGILIPRVSSFPTIAQAKGQVVFLQNNPNRPEGFYYYDGIDWESFLVDGNDRTIDQSIYVALGSGFSGSMNSNSERTLLFNTLETSNFSPPNHPTQEFSLTGNTLTVGKTGKYLVTLTSSLKRSITSDINRNIFFFRVKRNGTTMLTSSSSIPNQGTTASNISMSGILNLTKGDTVSATVQRNAEEDSGESPSNFSGYGTNTLTLIYLRN